VSFTKGCYIGQEVIARLDSQGKKPKQMVKINSYNAINRDDKIFSEDKDVGFISSVINYNGKYSGLGFIRSVNLDFENKYFSETNGEKFEINIYHV
jgi:folate-binding Fe-S cluster repair protein YgfZ